MLNCPDCGRKWPDDYGQTETWRDAAARWRDYARSLEHALEIERKRGDAWSAVAYERRHMLKVAWHKITGKPPVPMDPDKERPLVDLERIATVTEEAARDEEQVKKEQLGEVEQTSMI